jgi:hypothetical protein
VSDSLKFSITYPENWQIVEGYKPDRPIVIKTPLENEDDNFRENLNITILDSMPMTLEKVTNWAVEQYKTYLYKTLIDTVAYGKSAKGQKYGYIRYSHIDKEKFIEMLTYIYMRDDIAYIITCTMKLATFIKYEPDFIKTCQSFTFIK